MLDPRDRQLLLENLRPPEGYQLSSAVGTSFSLDLIALLVAPLAFTFFDWEDDEGRPTTEALALLESVRRHSEHIYLYCQAAEIGVPAPGQPLIAFLERCVVEVQAPRQGGVFHPKVWLLRFTRDGEPVRYRFLCLTRNLTFDRCWDTILSLDGELLDRSNAFSRNHPLGDFIAALPGLAREPQAEPDRKRVARMADEVRRVRFELPPEVEAVAFHPLGVGRDGQWRIGGTGGALLIMSPFVTNGSLASMTEARAGCVLISRPDELSKLTPEVLGRFERVLVLDSAAEDPCDDSDDTRRENLSGLHAKCYIEDDGWNAHVYTGSANATGAAFERNVEFITELVGKKSRFGIRRFLDGPDEAGSGFLRLLQPWKGEPTPQSEDAQIREALEDKLAEARRILARLPLVLRCRPEENQYSLEVFPTEPWPDFDGIELKLWPATLRADAGSKPVRGATATVRFGPMTLDLVTAFLAFELVAESRGVRAQSRFAVRLPLEGVPSDRMERLLASQLADPERVLRLLWLLLQPDAPDVSGLSHQFVGDGSWVGGTAGYPIFERLIRSCVESGPRILEVGRIVEDLSRTEQGRRLMPEGLDVLWRSLKQWMEERRAGQTRAEGI